MSEGWEDLKGSKYDWLSNVKNLSRKRQRHFKSLRQSTLKTARAWALKDLAMRLWHYVSRPGRRNAGSSGYHGQFDADWNRLERSPNSSKRIFGVL